MSSELLETTLDTVGGHPLRVARTGAGAALVLLHGYPENLLLFSRLARLLSQTFTVFAFDWPGMGESGAWPGGATPLHQARRLVALLDHWKVERASIFGMDMGGQPALSLAAHFPERVESVVVANSLVAPTAETSLDLRLLRRFGLNRFLLKSFPRAVFSRALRSFMNGSEPLPKPLRQALWASFRRPEVREFIVRMCAGYQAQLPLLQTRYRDIRAPTLFLWAEHEAHFPLVHAQTAAREVPGARVEQLSGANHWMVWTHAEQVAERIRAHVATSSPATSPLPRAGGEPSGSRP